jgi:hypothetical protein
VAEAIKTTNEAVRYELEHLREQAHSNPQTQIHNGNIAEPAPASTVPAVNNISYKSHIFLLASTHVVEENLAKRLIDEMVSIKTIADLVEPAEPELSGLIFSLEQQFAELPKLAVIEEVVSKLNQLKTSLIRQRLTEFRLQLQEMSDSKDDTNFEEVLITVTEYEKMLREPLFDATTFLDKKD